MWYIESKQLANRTDEALITGRNRATTPNSPNNKHGAK